MKLVQLAAISSGEKLEQLTNAQVRELQTALTAAGFSAGGVDGVLGPGTRGAFAAFKQSIASADPDAIGPASVDALQKLLDAPPPSSDGAQSVPPQAVAIIKAFEGCVLTAYPDPASGGVPWTIGYGTTVYPNGRAVQPGETITEAQAESALAYALVSYVKTLAGSVPAWAQMNANMRAALLSFAYNLGETFYGSDGFETISRVLRDRLWGQVPDAMALYSDPGTPVHDGLLRRRQAEGLLWQGEGPYARPG